MIDTLVVARDTRIRALLAGLLLGMLALTARASAEPRDLNATVVWVRGESVYIAAPDSGALAPPALLTLVYRGKPVATAEVVRVLDRELTLAKLTSGSLARVKQPTRLRVLGEPQRVAPPALLRVGFPAAHRPNLLVACEEVTLDPARVPRGYRTEQATGRTFRLVRGTEASSPVPWPDTLVLRAFDDAADEEIALERGELDAGVFLAGELSAHMREGPRWQEPLFGLRDGVALAAIASESDAADSSTAIDSLAFEGLNRELFRGDLAPSAAGPAVASNGRRTGITRYVVDPSCPGRAALERYLNRGLKLPAAERGMHTVRVVCLEGAGARPDSARASAVFLPRSPLVCARSLRPYLSALGADALVNLLACRPAGGKP